MLARALHDGPVEAFTVAIEAASSTDRSASEHVCDHLGIPLRVVTLTVSELTSVYLSRGVAMMESFEPALVRNGTIYNMLSRAVRAAGYKFCLSGEGADEVFGGYGYFKCVPEPQKDDLIHRSLEEIHRTYLQMADRASMHASLEVRVPYMDYGLVRTAAVLPPKLRIDGDMDKVALRNLYPGNLPELNRRRDKEGMNSGAGFGSNDPFEGIYAAAVDEHYRKHTGALDRDLNTVGSLRARYALDLRNREEVYNLAQYIRLGYADLAAPHERPQLNTSKLRPY
jgi:asparagine synthase (glutamine-hydrolysing)